MRVLLVYPRNLRANWRGSSRLVQTVLRKDSVFLSATLPTIAALTPPEFDVEIVDELLHPIDPARRYDVVGITSAPTEFLRAAELAAHFRAQGSVVVVGGPPASANPARWRAMADVLVLGEAERTWPQFLADLAARRHRDEYREDGPVDLTQSPRPDYRPLPAGDLARYGSGVVQTSRGCPYRCEFCAVTAYLGHKMRYKTPDQVLAEIEQLYALGYRAIFLADDNFAGDRKRARVILEAIRGFNAAARPRVSFNTQLSINTADDPDFLALCAEAGLTRVLIGIDSPREESLREARKGPNLGRDVVADLRRFHQHGIVTVGATIVGFDHDDLTSFRQHFEFFMKQGLPIVQVAALQALDGTALKERIAKEGRYIDWENACRSDPRGASSLNSFTLVPKQMTLDQLRQGVYWLFWNLCRTDNTAERLRRFFEDYESGPRALKRPSGWRAPDRGTLGVVWRLARHLALRASADERAGFLEMIGHARRSSHPQAYEIAVLSFLAARSSQEVLEAEDPAVATLADPGFAVAPA